MHAKAICLDLKCFICLVTSYKSYKSQGQRPCGVQRRATPYGTKSYLSLAQVCDLCQQSPKFATSLHERQLQTACILGTSRRLAPVSGLVSVTGLCLFFARRQGMPCLYRSLHPGSRSRPPGRLMKKRAHVSGKTYSHFNENVLTFPRKRKHVFSCIFNHSLQTS